MEVLYKVILPFVVAFLVSRLLIYSWMGRTASNSGFSPTVASILSAPILAAIYFSALAAGVGIGPAIIYDTSGNIVFRLAFSLFLFWAPILFILAPLLVIYLVMAFRRKKAMSPIVPLVATITCLVLQFFWLSFIFDNG